MDAQSKAHDPNIIWTDGTWHFKFKDGAYTIMLCHTLTVLLLLKDLFFTENQMLLPTITVAGNLQ